jgi:transcriptional regulator with XRE-family HTH domain
MRLTWPVRMAYIRRMKVLAKWMAEHNVNDAALAEKLEISRVHASRLRRDICKPSLATAHKLEALTNISAPAFIFGEAA